MEEMDLNTYSDMIYVSSALIGMLLGWQNEGKIS